MTYRQRLLVSGLDRRDVARRMGLSYSALTSRLGNFTSFTVEEEAQLRQILREAEEGQRAEDNTDEN